MAEQILKRNRNSRRLIFEMLERRSCLSASGVLAFPDVDLTFEDPSFFQSSAISANQAITSDAGTQNSPSVAVDPLDPNRVVVAFADYALLSTGYAGIAVAASQDGGASWEHRTLALPSGFEQGASDPTVNFDGRGHVYISYMAAKFNGASKPPLLNPGGGAQRAMGFKANNGIFVSRSDDGGLTWMSPVAVASHVYDGVTQVPFEIYPDLAVDNIPKLPDGQTNPNYGNLYATWARYYPVGQFPGEAKSIGGSDVMIAVSSDSGLTWKLRTQPQATSDGLVSVLRTNGNTGLETSAGLGYLNWSRIAVGAAGNVAVADFVAGWFVVNNSNDAAATFFVPTREDFVGLPFGTGGRLLTAGLSDNSFRTVPTRAIAADPLRPGFLYAAEPLPVFDAVGNPVDAAEIFFARSEDYGRTWKSIKIPGTSIPRSVNDDNGGKRSDGTLQDVTADQFMVRMEVNAAGDVGLVWYDTRHDPGNHLIDVFGAISTDAGKTFSPNFRVSDRSFDADQGKFTDSMGNPILFLGDTVGFAMSDQSAYVAWTDTRNGNQDIYFRKLPIDPPPVALNDRFEPNDDLAKATALGPIVTRTLPRLALDVADTDWFRLKASASGTLTVTVRSDSKPEQIELQIFDAQGEQVVGESSLLRDGQDQVVGRQATLASAAGQQFTVRIASKNSAAKYSLEATSLTEDLGPLVLRNLSGSLGADDQAYYLFETAAAGTIVASLGSHASAASNAHLELLDGRDLSTIADATGPNPSLSLAVKPGQKLLLRVSAAGQWPAGLRESFDLQLVNLDQFASTNQNLFQFPTGAGPSQMAIGDFNGDNVVDVAVTNTGVNTVSVSLGNGDGTFSAPRQFSVGAFRTPNPVGDDANLLTYRRDILAEDFDQDSILDLVVTNFDSSDVSVLLGRGDGTFQPQRRFDAAAFPIGVTSGDVNGDGYLDLVVIDSPEINVPNKLAVLLGRGDGTFTPQKTQELPKILFLAVVALGDFDNDGYLDLVAGGGINEGLDIFRGLGDGSFKYIERTSGSRQAASLAVVDLDGDGNLDIIATSLSDNNAVTIVYGTGDLKFKAPLDITDVGQGPLSIRVFDWGSQSTLPDDSVVIGPRDGKPDLIIANSGVIPGPFNSIGPPGIVMLPRLADEKDGTARFGDPISLARAEQPLDIEIADFDRDGNPDISVVDRSGFFVIYGKAPNIKSNISKATARDLGTVVHIVQPTLTIVPGHEDSWFRMQVASEVVAGAGDQVIDFSAEFAHVTGLGLEMEVIDSQGRLRGSGGRFRVVAQQGESLFVHLFSRRAVAEVSGAGAYTLVIDTLPQLVAVEAPTLLPRQGAASGGTTASLVLVFQGDRLDPITAQEPNNYSVTWLGSDGILGTDDDRNIPVGSGLTAAQSAIYSPSGNLDVASGRTYPSAVRQTVTLLFAQALPAGSYRIEVSPQVTALPFNPEEAERLNGQSTAHGVVTRNGNQITNGINRVFTDLVAAPASSFDFSVFTSGTRFLTQLHNDLSAILDFSLSSNGDVVHRNTEELMAQIVARFAASLGPIGERSVSMLIVLLDPVSIGLEDPEKNRFGYDLQRNTLANALPRSFVEVGGNVELIAIAQPTGMYRLDIADVPKLARGGWALLDNERDFAQILTSAIRDNGQRTFQLGFARASATASSIFLVGQPVSASLLALSTNLEQAASTQVIFGSNAKSTILDGLLKTRVPASSNFTWMRRIYSDAREAKPLEFNLEQTDSLDPTLQETFGLSKKNASNRKESAGKSKATGPQSERSKAEDQAARNRANANKPNIPTPPAAEPAPRAPNPSTPNLPAEGSSPIIDPGGASHGTRSPKTDRIGSLASLPADSGANAD